MKRQIIISGGFHNSPEKIFLVPYTGTEVELVDFRFTDSQIYKLNKHFCGIRSCSCGGAFHSSVVWELKNI